MSCPSGDERCRSITLPVGLSVTGTDCFLQSRLLSGSFVMGFWTTLNDQSAESQDHFPHCIHNLSYTHTHTHRFIYFLFSLYTPPVLHLFNCCESFILSSCFSFLFSAGFVFVSLLFLSVYSFSKTGEENKCFR